MQNSAVDNTLVFEITVDVAAGVGWKGLIISGCPPDFLHLVAPGVVTNTTIQLNFENKSALVDGEIDGHLQHGSHTYQSVVMRAYNHTLPDGSSLCWDIDRNNVTELEQYSQYPC